MKLVLLFTALALPVLSAPLAKAETHDERMLRMNYAQYFNEGDSVIEYKSPNMFDEGGGFFEKTVATVDRKNQKLIFTDKTSAHPAACSSLVESSDGISVGDMVHFSSGDNEIAKGKVSKIAKFHSWQETYFLINGKNWVTKKSLLAGDQD